MDIPIEESIETLADWYAQNSRNAAEMRSKLYLMTRRLSDYYKDNGPIQTPHGVVTMIPDGYDWDDEAVSEVMPSLVSYAEVTFAGKLEQIERVLSLVSEEMPMMGFDVKHKVDTKEAARVIRMKGDAAAKLEECRTPRGKLGVTE